MKIDIVILASGLSKRFGSDKPLYNINNKPIFLYPYENALKLKEETNYIDDIIVVSRFDEIKNYCVNSKYIENRDYKEGISASIRLGVKNSNKDNAIMFMVCDQPFTKYESLCEMIKGFINSSKSFAALCDRYKNIGNPCIFSHKYKKELLLLKGDRGGKAIIKKHIEDIFLYKVEEIELFDMDYPMPFLLDNRHIISIVGAGGKTSLMYYLAEKLSYIGKKVLVTTSTRIYKPNKNYAKDKLALLNLWNDNKYAVVGKELSNGKLTMPDNIKDYIKLADFTLIEADGARHLPIKVPYDYEPVIIDESDVVIYVVGLDSIGKKLSDVCYNFEGAMKLLNVDCDHIVNEDDIINIINSKNGGRKNVKNRDFYIVLNKADLYKGENFMKGENLWIMGK
ncbi:MAG: selenium cofactor biosynthesis protein YqeC [Lachnospirales bacterium]